MATQIYAELNAHLDQNKTLSLYDVQRILDSDNITEVQELFTKFAYKGSSRFSKHFMVTNYEDCSSQIVTELELTKMREADKVDDACLLYVVTL